MVVTVVLGIYVAVGMPPFLAKLTLMTYSTSGRCADMLGYVQVVLFVAAMTHYREEEKIKAGYSIIIAVLLSAFAVLAANRYVPDYMSKGYMALSMFVLAGIYFCCLTKEETLPKFLNNRKFFVEYSKKLYCTGLIAIIFVSVITGIYIRPLMKGLDAIYSKPLSTAIQDIVSKDREAKWVAHGALPLPGFMISCGAPTINSVNTYPNMKLWKSLDKAGVYEEVYNRYAHILVEFTDGETSMELIQPDCFCLRLSYQDFEKTDIDYIVSSSSLEIDNQYLSTEELYNEAGSYIYKINYK